MAPRTPAPGGGGAALTPTSSAHAHALHPVDLVDACTADPPTARALAKTLRDVSKQLGEVAVGASVALLPDGARRALTGTVDVQQVLAASGSRTGNRVSIDPAPGGSEKAGIAAVVATRAWLAMRRTRQDQVINLHTTGLGTHDAVKRAILDQLLRHSASISTSATRVHTDLVKAHILLDLLGSATNSARRTSRRFGLFTELQYDAAGALMGAKLCEYHLESTRVSNPPPGESNFHALYAVCAAAAAGVPEIKALKLLPDASKYRLVAQGAAVVGGAVTATTYTAMTRCMKALGMKKRFQTHFFSVLAALLLLGNVDFEADGKNKQSAASIKNPDVLAAAARHLGVSTTSLETVLTCKTIVHGDSAYTDFLAPDQAALMRDQLVRDLYATLFAYVLETINQRLNQAAHQASMIGLVDMGGIETAPTNGIHQLCRNYAAERVHNMQMRALEHRHAEWARELAAIPQVLPADPPVNVMDDVLSVIEQQTKAAAAAKAGAAAPASPSATGPTVMPSSMALLDHLHAKFATRARYALPAGDSAAGFAIRHSLPHSAKDTTVVYSLAVTLTHVDALVNPEFIKLFRSQSRNPVAEKMFGEHLVETYAAPERARTIVAGRTALRRNPTRRVAKPNKAALVNAKPAPSPVAEADEDEDDDDASVPLSRVSNTVLGQHRVAMDKLVQSLEGCAQWSVVVMPPGDVTEDLCTSLELPAIVSMARATPFWQLQTVEEVLAQHRRHLFAAKAAESDRAGPRADSTLPGGAAPAGGADDVIAALAALGINVTAAASGAVLFKVHEWLALEAHDLTVNPDQYTFADSPPTVRKVLDKLERPEKDDETASMAETANTDGELGDEPRVGPAGAGAAPASAKPTAPPPPPQVNLTGIRRRWLFTTKVLTWWIPSRLLEWWGHMERPDIQQAWREKVALCIIIGALSAIMLFFITGFGDLLCPQSHLFSAKQLFALNTDPSTSKSNVFALHGVVYDATGYLHPNVAGFSQQKYLNLRGTADAQAFFPRWDPSTGAAPAVCGTGRTFDVTQMDAAKCTTRALTASNYTAYCHDYISLANKVLYRDPKLGWARYGTMAYALGEISLHASSESAWIVIRDKVYDVTALLGPNSPLPSVQVDLLAANAGKDISTYGATYVNVGCLDATAYIGVVDRRDQTVCMVGQYILMGVTYIMVAVMVIKFLSALQLGSKRRPEDIDRFVIMQVPCYSESTESLKKTIDSLSLTSYNDTRKLLFIVADGMVKGSGNDKPTPDLVLDILGVPDADRNAQPFSYHAIGEGSKAHNKGKVYSGLYRIQGRAVPYMVVVKCGTEKETAKAGNRGKRDSQMVLMRFLNKVFFNAPMTPLELEMYRHIRNVIGVPPGSYEFLLCVDADTEVGPECLTRLISACINDSKIMGLCGETKIANEKQTWVTMIQVYEYYISHHLAKAFESLFGSVTCLPGCFCMYKLYSTRNDKRTPLVIAPQIIQDYSEPNVDTLHKKNLLMLGEDRYLTTLLLKHFPEYKMKFTPDSWCLTIVPEKFSILLSQRRRWINSTIHNLFELTTVSDLCGCLIFSMRFVVLLDLFATLVMPASVGYLAYMLYLVAQDSEAHKQALILVGVTYGLQAVIFLIKRQWQHIGWMIIHIIAMPVFYMYIPLYSFWHFDDFSWGATRRIEGDSGKGGHEGDNDQFDPATIPTAKWDDYKRLKRTEASLMEIAKSADVLNAPPTTTTTSPRKVGKMNGKSPSLANLRSAASTTADGGVELGVYSSAANLLALNKSMSMSNMLTPATGKMGSMVGMSPSMNQLFAPPSAASAAVSRVGVAAPPGMPTDHEIWAAVRAIMMAHDLATLTKKKVRAELAARFQVDLASRREVINACIEAVLAEMPC
ncbi:hypothetical protein AMAG_17354 [Allomyces macrogynus ATCC 38327]|uniref:chitin synthase n=1 Tax=Allomyces macrogynus (strain ATCC 38327) TaxID=578462 RepID=A0A0L0TEN4_ALLM3|nr:hypothetical protein AMAG_17354 [Allomyces macrogynus ATCC 38327]|eukprot:KNE73155.1 hypothetical protein AMAG_17354 [Allomyces macrogynus ATCC 38327]